MNKKSDAYWDKINNFLINATASTSIKEFSVKILNEISSIIDFDNSAVILEVDKEYNSQITESMGIGSKWIESYNNYYYKIALKPEIAYKNLKAKSNEWNETNKNEYVRDFLIPQKIYNTAVAVFIGGLGKPRHSLIINRSRSKLNFSTKEISTLKLVESHLNNHYKLLEIINNFKNISVLKQETESKNSLLSPRESEIIAMLIKRQKPAEIAKELLISIFTVRKHIQNIYEKLAVYNKHDLLRKIIN